VNASQYHSFQKVRAYLELFFTFLKGLAAACALSGISYSSRVAKLTTWDILVSTFPSPLKIKNDGGMQPYFKQIRQYGGVGSTRKDIPINSGYMGFF